MKWLTIRDGQAHTLGLADGDEIIVLKEALAAYPSPGIPTDIMAVIAGGLSVASKIGEYVKSLPVGRQSFRVQERELLLGPCVTNPGKIVCVGLNYRKHAIESNAPIPQFPILFNKFNNTLAAHGDDIPLHGDVTSEVDYEVELAIVIGAKARSVGRDVALDYVYGYCCANDLSARDLQMRTTQWLTGKSLDGFCPLGPYLVTADEIPDPNALEMRLTVNGEARQHSNTADMIFDCKDIVSYVSRHMTLEPGDVILTGTPEGVVLGLPPERRVYLKDGDVVTIEIDKLGTLTNRMIDAPVEPRA